MAIWEDNQARYAARLELLQYFCHNWWRWLQTKECNPRWHPDEDYNTVEPAIDFEEKSWLPECVYTLNYDDFTSIRDTAHWVWCSRYATRQYTIDDLLTKLNWAFNPQDIKDIKIIYKEPEVPRGKDGRRKRK